MFAPAPRAGHGRRQLVISMPLMMVSLTEQPPQEMGRDKGGTVRPRWRIASGGPAETGPVSITDGNSIPSSVVPIYSQNDSGWVMRRLSYGRNGARIGAASAQAGVS